MRLLAHTLLTVSDSDKGQLGANQSTEIRTEAQHCVPLRMNPNFSDMAFHIRSIPDMLSSSRHPSVVRRRRSISPLFSKIFSFKTAKPIKAIFYVEPPWVGERKFV